MSTVHVLGSNWSRRPGYTVHRGRFCSRHGRWGRILTTFRYVTGPNEALRGWSALSLAGKQAEKRP